MYTRSILAPRKNILLKKYTGYKFACTCMHNLPHKNGVKSALPMYVKKKKNRKLNLKWR